MLSASPVRYIFKCSLWRPNDLPLSNLGQGSQTRGPRATYGLLSYLVYSLVLKNARPASEQVPFKRI